MITGQPVHRYGTGVCVIGVDEEPEEAPPAGYALFDPGNTGTAGDIHQHDIDVGSHHGLI